MSLPDQSWSHCFACGPNEAHGLRIAYHFEGDEELRAALRFDARFQGFDGVVHGGILATCLDDAMANLACLKGERALTAELAVRFRRAVVVDEPVELVAWIEERAGRLLKAAAQIRDAAGVVRAEGSGKFLIAGRLAGG
jgi:uncharacterized protein (TIGR00369 family)